MIAGDGPQPEESVDSTFRQEVLERGWRCWASASAP
jgi:hypothetical protein